MAKNIYELELHESLKVYESSNTEIFVIRVPGGWIYDISKDKKSGKSYTHTNFVPFHKEFKEKSRSTKINVDK
ncbi:MAG: hypothetical protein V7767_05180 [Leeuwenhoekiella sp.]